MDRKKYMRDKIKRQIYKLKLFDHLVEYNSLEFENAFLEHLNQYYESTRVAATVAYDAYLLDRHRAQLHGTRWVNLDEFVCFLDLSGKCKVENTENGKFITYTNPDSFFREISKKKEIEKLIKRMRASSNIATATPGAQRLSVSEASASGVVVKVTNKSLEYYDRIGIVTKVLDEDYAEIMILDATNQHLRLHQNDLQMLVP